MEAVNHHHQTTRPDVPPEMKARLRAEIDRIRRLSPEQRAALLVQYEKYTAEKGTGVQAIIEAKKEVTHAAVSRQVSLSPEDKGFVSNTDPVFESKWSGKYVAPSPERYFNQERKKQLPSYAASDYISSIRERDKKRAEEEERKARSGLRGLAKRAIAGIKNLGKTEKPINPHLTSSLANALPSNTAPEVSVDSLNGQTSSPGVSLERPKWWQRPVAIAVASLAIGAIGTGYYLKQNSSKTSKIASEHSAPSADKPSTVSTGSTPPVTPKNNTVQADTPDVSNLLENTSNNIVSLTSPGGLGVATLLLRQAGFPKEYDDTFNLMYTAYMKREANKTGSNNSQIGYLQRAFGRSIVEIDLTGFKDQDGQPFTVTQDDLDQFGKILKMIKVNDKPGGIDSFNAAKGTKITVEDFSNFKKALNELFSDRNGNLKLVQPPQKKRDELTSKDTSVRNYDSGATQTLYDTRTTSLPADYERVQKDAKSFLAKLDAEDRTMKNTPAEPSSTVDFITPIDSSVQVSQKTDNAPTIEMNDHDTEYLDADQLDELLALEREVDQSNRTTTSTLLPNTSEPTREA